jgi:hypothetical protein
MRDPKSKPNIIRRRRVPRREFLHPVGLLVSGNYFMSRALQIGEGGMLIESATPLAMGQRLVLSFKLPGFNPDVVTASVRYILKSKIGSGVRYGVEFLNLDFNVKRDVRNYVATQVRLADEPI